MSEHWHETTLEGCCDILDRLRQPISSAERAKRPGTVPYFGAAGQAGWIDEAIFDEPLVLLGEDAVDFASPTARKAYCIEGPSWVNNHAHVLRAGNEFVNSLMLELLLNAVDYTNYAVFGTRSKLTQAAMKSIRLFLPPLDEQRRIVDLVGSIDAYIDSLETQIETTRTARSALLSELLSNPGDDWDKCRLIDICEVYQPKTISKAEMQDDGEYVVYGANGPIGRFSEFNHDQPEVVVTCRGATCGTLNMTPPKVWITGNAMVVSPKDARLSKGFLFSALQTADLDQFISGSAQPQITRSTLGQLVLPIPDSGRQGEIAELVGSFDEQMLALESQVEAVRSFRAGVLAELLSGERLLDESYDVAVGL